MGYIIPWEILWETSRDNLWDLLLRACIGQRKEDPVACQASYGMFHGMPSIRGVVQWSFPSAAPRKVPKSLNPCHRMPHKWGFKAPYELSHGMVHGVIHEMSFGCRPSHGPSHRTSRGPSMGCPSSHEIQGLRMGRAGQHFELFDSILKFGRVKQVTTRNHSLRVQYVRQCQEFDIDYQS